jgi:ferredoxin
MDLKYREILTGDRQLGPYPLEKLPRVDVATTRSTVKTKRRTLDDRPFAAALRGELGNAVKEGTLRFYKSEPILAALTGVHEHLAAYAPPPVAERKAPLPDDPHILTRHIKSLAYFLGADMVGVCKLPKTAVYAPDAKGNPPVDCDYAYAIVVINKKKTDTIRASYGREWIDDPVSFQVYQQCGLQCQNIADYIRRLGYPALPSIVGTYTTLITPLIIEAGLGEGSRLGIAINPFIGAAFKAAAVLTDMPLEPDKPIDFGLQAYCKECKICAEQCFMRAISDREKEEYNGYETYRHNRNLCFSGMMTNPIGNFCQRCAKTCPWNRPDNRPEDFRDWGGDLKFLYDSVNRQAEHLRKNDFVEPDEYMNKWWFPLAYEDDKLVEAPEFDYKTHETRMKKLRQMKEEGKRWGIAPDYE